VSIYWVVLFVAVVVEIAWALSMKWMQVSPGVLSISTACVLVVVNMALLSYAMRGIPVGTAYAVWTGLGAVGVMGFGVWLYGDPLHWPRFVFAGLIIIGVAGLKFSSA
jgi:quaternary ammonium compound-resistance protein SugE